MFILVKNRKITPDSEILINTIYGKHDTTNYDWNFHSNLK